MMQNCFKNKKSSNVIYYVNVLKQEEKKSMIISVDSEKAYEKIQRPFMIRKENASNGSRKVLP